MYYGPDGRPLSRPGDKTPGDDDDDDDDKDKGKDKDDGADADDDKDDAAADDAGGDDAAGGDDGGGGWFGGGGDDGGGGGGCGGGGSGWRGQRAPAIQRRADLGFVEILAEDYFLGEALPTPLLQLQHRGVRIVPHGVGLSLGGAAPIDPWRVDALAQFAQQVQAPLVSEHLAFVRAAGLETGHLLPVQRSRDMLDIVVENIQQAEAVLPVPLAIENISTLFEWPDNEMDEGTFLTQVLERTEALLMLDIENVYANARNLGGDPSALLDTFPLHKIAYVHIAGGIENNGIYHDTHAQPIPDDVLALLEELCARAAVPGVMLERDDRFPSDAELNAELDAITAAMHRGQARRTSSEFAHHSA
ncbi:MAG: DUF692 domain-containing protein [Planctomycetes bacterium]|nr:DUF692 domain-containing protein [Planctomycetota bacterium]